MIEIVPNLHPLIVHFPIALTLSATAFALAGLVAGDRPIAAEWRAASRWMLRLAALTALLAAWAGAVAFDSVDHDEISHRAMLEHRFAAIVAVLSVLAVALWDIAAARGLGRLLPVLLLLASVAMANAARLGGDLVYRHGLGVERRPLNDSPAPAASTTPAAVAPAGDAVPASSLSAPAAKPAPAAKVHRHKDGSTHVHSH